MTPNSQFISDDLVADAMVALFNVTGPPGKQTANSKVQTGSQTCTIKGTATFDANGARTQWQAKAQELLDTLQQVRYALMSSPRIGWPLLARTLSVSVDHSAGALPSLYNIEVKKQPLSNGQTGIELSR
jgi:hypothetical protein